MALSDTAFETRNRLINDFHNYVDWGYSIENWDQYISAILSLGSVQADLDHVDPSLLDEQYRNMKIKDKNINMNEQIIEQLLAGSNSNQPKRETLLVLCNVAKVNKNFYDAIISVYKWRKTDDGTRERITREDDEYVPIEELYNMVTQA